MANSARMNVALEAVDAAAKVIRRFDRHRGSLKVDEKAPGDFVTNADLASEEAVIDVLSKRYPEDGVLSEERGAHGPDDSCWVLDPIDGTTNFVQGLPYFAVSLAWCKDGEPVVGVICDLGRDETYTAERGNGARCEGRRVRVSGNRRFSTALLGSTGKPGTRSWRWGFLGEASRRTSGFRRLGAVTLDFVHAARGNLDAAFGAGLHYWDYAAGSLILREAGGAFFNGLSAETEVAFGSRLGDCVFGTPRIAGTLRRMAAEHEREAGETGR